ncbi:hypothetical protein FAZ69_23180 [Trinickia terrae]|uniref:Adhesin n=1 Tax=Trinickia terrae TaxID=2571161 RepID=A0A4U1HXU1_9BURK|nr:hypothetical protein [Trinickia terrae]TKC83926.1 hypothetical protein FAZ69_23180 [Trinickia terrae]
MKAPLTTERRRLANCALTCLAGVAALTFAAPHHALAQAAVVTGDASIAPGALNGANGALTVNETAGLNNAQSNQLAIVSGTPNGGVYNGGSQSASAAARVTSAHASIEGNAFSNTSGAVMVNQSAGAANLQRNSVGLGAAVSGMETVSDSELSATAPKQGGLGPRAGAHDAREAIISNDAFKNVNGVAQINQTAGAGNATANSFVLRPPAGTFF